MRRTFPPLLLALVAGLLLAPGAPAQITQTEETRPRVSSPGALLDDYEIVEPRSITFTFGAGYVKVPSGWDVWAPSADFSMGLTRWMDISMYSSVSKTSIETFRTTAVGDSYINAKFILLKEGPGRPGIAFQPVLEVLGRPSLANNPLAPNKVNAVFGGMVGKNLWETIRVYNHTGYFTRGIVFTSAALEFTRLRRVTPVVFATFGALTAHRETVAERELNASRPDVGGTLGFRLAKDWSGWISVSRSIGRRDFNSVTVSVGGGVSYTWRPWSE